MPEPIADTNQTPTAQVPPPPAPAPVVQPTPTTSAGGVGVTPSGGANPPTVPPTPSSPSANAAPQIPADVQAQLDRYRAMEREYQDLAQHRHLIPLGMDAYRRAQQGNPNATPAQAQQTYEHPWGLPQFDHRLLDFVGVDPQTRELVLRPGAPPDALIRVQEYQAKLKEAQTNFFSDPSKALAPIIEKMFGGLFEKQFSQQFGQIQQHQTSQQIIADNQDWIYAKDQSGGFSTRFNPATGRYDRVLSPHGEQYVHFLRQADQFGIKDQAAAHQFARTNLENMLFQQRYAQDRNQQQGVQQQQQVIQQGNQTAAQQLTGHNPAVQPPAAGPKSMRDLLRERFEQNGLTDQVVEQQVARSAA